MCGIAGISCIAKPDERMNIALVMLGMHMENRGRQAWGWTDGTQIVKQTGTFQSGMNDSFYNFPKWALHTRYGTTGANTEENAHPWKIGDLIGMHNGVVHNHEELNKKYERKCTVDSQHIFHHLAEGLDLSEIRAYGAVAFFKDGDLHIGRFNNGDLTLVRTDVAWLYASTRSALEDALRFSGLRKENPIYFKLKEEVCYRLTESKELVRSDIKLNLGSYSKNWRTWEEGENRPYNPYYRGGTAGTGNPTGSKGYVVHDRRHHSGQQGLLSSVSGAGSDDKEEPQNQQKGTTPETKGTSSGATTTQDASKMGAGRLANLTLEEKVRVLVNETIDRNNPAKRKEEAEWKCGYCQVELVDGKPTYLAISTELVCEECSIRYASDLEGGPFYVLPNEIVLVDSMFKPEEEDKGLDCDVCGEGMFRGEYFVNTKDNDFLCIQCFLDVDTEAKADQEIELGAEDDEELHARRMDQIEAAEEEYYKELAKRHEEEAAALNPTQKKPVVRAVPRNIGPEPLMNDTESLKRFGSGIPPSNFRSRLLN